MKHIKIYEDFSFNSKINEAKEITLPGGFINSNTDDNNSEGVSLKKGVTFFLTNTSTPNKNLGVPHLLEITTSNDSNRVTLSFNSDTFQEGEKTINLRNFSFKDLQPGISSSERPDVLAKNPSEASSKAFEILAYISTTLTKNPGDPKTMGDLVRSFFEIKKLYPEYMTKNSLFRGFIEGITKGFTKPNFGRFNGSDNFRQKEQNTSTEVRSALRDVGVLS